MTLTDSDLSAIEAIVDRQLNAFRASPVLPPVPLPTKLTLGEFAWCVQRNRATVAKRRRLNRKFAQYCEGRRPVLIHPEALALWGLELETGGLTDDCELSFSYEKTVVLDDHGAGFWPIYSLGSADTSLDCGGAK